MALRYLPEVHSPRKAPQSPQKPPGSTTCRGIHIEKIKRQKKSFLFMAQLFKKNESGRDFQRGQIWNNRSQKQKKNYGRHPVPRAKRRSELFWNDRFFCNRACNLVKSPIQERDSMQTSYFTHVAWCNIIMRIEIKNCSMHNNTIKNWGNFKSKRANLVKHIQRHP